MSSGTAAGLVTVAMSVLLALSTVLGSPSAHGEPTCAVMRVTGYLRSEGGPRTYDGTDITTSEPIAAASWDIPMGAVVDVDGLGSYRVADRGALGSDGWVDIATWSREEAYAVTGWRRACWTAPPAEG